MHIFWCGFRRKFDEILNFTIPKFKMSNSVTNVSQKSKNVEFYQILIIFYHIRPIFRILTAVKTQNLPGNDILFHLVCAEWSKTLEYLFLNLKICHMWAQIVGKGLKPSFLPHLDHFWMIQNFPGKSGSVSFFQLLGMNFRHKIWKIVGAVFEKFCQKHQKWPKNAVFSDFWMIQTFFQKSAWQCFL